MAWFLNNNHRGAADAAMSFAHQHEDLGGTYFSYGDEDRARITKRIANERALLFDQGLGDYRRSSLLCDVVRIDGRVPNKDIVDVQVYPPFPDEINTAILTAVRAAMDLANNSAS